MNIRMGTREVEHGPDVASDDRSEGSLTNTSYDVNYADGASSTFAADILDDDQLRAVGEYTTLRTDLNGRPVVLTLEIDGDA